MFQAKSKQQPGYFYFSNILRSTRSAVRMSGWCYSTESQRFFPFHQYNFITWVWGSQETHCWSFCFPERNMWYSNVNGGCVLLLGAGSYAHAHAKTAQCLMGHVTVTMEYTAMSSAAVKWRQKGRTSFPRACCHSHTNAQIQSFTWFVKKKKKKIQDGKTPQGSKMLAAAQ